MRVGTRNSRIGVSCAASLIAIAGFTFACNKSNESTEAVSDSTSNVTESAASTVGNIAGDTESGSVGFAADDSHGLLAACSLAAARSTCSGASSDTITVTWNDCTILLGTVTLSGGWTNRYDSAGTCTTARTAALPSGGSVTRTSDSYVVAFRSGAYLTTDTTTHTAWDGTSIPATGVVTTNNSGTRTVVINGLHRVLRGPRGTRWFDHSITSSGLTVTGTHAAGTRTVSGNMTVYHNIARYTATSTFNSVQWGSSSCCYPTSGSISTALAGAVAGTTTLTYSSTCGQATFVDTSGASSTIELSYCQ